ncbi:hypothetical protein [Microbulbifer marinus]|uniref:Endonuclease/Exonuclease/phosphatase family protein n=1 Tax=Microbulbifer marinus TaxID=658218 RepID=A0A1H3VL36_9GAMM|nr:hypothetical protein [Microbulbifer marinus]SDZ75507.1 hypothetical protein SAMN05216562_0047 [Microbulbifer marinus]
MPIFAYQSLNSNSSTEHGISASNSQHFTRMTHDSIAANSSRWMLSMPTADGVAPHVPVHGPAELLSTAQQGYMAKGRHDDASFLAMVQGKARQTHQQLIRALGGCDLLVYGELDGSHSAWNSMQQNAGQLFSVSSASKACNCFSVHAANNSQHRALGEGFGWVAIRTGNVNAVFVHVPNAIAKSESAAVDFYKGINNHLLHLGAGQIDIIMGDTNQPSNGFTQRILGRAVGQAFADAHPGATIQPYDSYQRSFGGTNSTGSRKYDVAVYNTATVGVDNMVYLSQCTPVSGQNGSSAAAVTDHMGIGIEVVK